MTGFFFYLAMGVRWITRESSASSLSNSLASSSSERLIAALYEMRSKTYSFIPEIKHLTMPSFPLWSTRAFPTFCASFDATWEMVIVTRCCRLNPSSYASSKENSFSSERLHRKFRNDFSLRSKLRTLSFLFYSFPGL